ncbi:hypothetical protein EC968_006085 [Mortierella alpina]|nr:hypothetical protein EC968_006085 [Mortierella alpina]
MATTPTDTIHSESRLSTADSDSSNERYQIRQQLQDQQPSVSSEYTSRPMSTLPATRALNVQGGAKLRPRSLVVYPTQLPVVSDNSSQSSRSSNASDTSSTASSRSSAYDPSALKRYTLTDNPVRVQPPSQPAHRSKLSKQYTPSESEGSDDDRSDQAQSQLRRTRVTGRPKELTSSVAAERLRAISRMDLNQTQPSALASEAIETSSLNTVKKKMSFTKRISRLFSSSKNTKGSLTDAQATTIAPASTAPAPSSAFAKPDSQRSCAISRVGTPSLEVIDELSSQEPSRPQVYMHPRSQSSPDMMRRNGQSMSNTFGGSGNLNRHSMIAQDNNDLQIRSSGLDDEEAPGHRRYSSANGPSTSGTSGGSRISMVHPRQRQRALSANKYPNTGNRSSVFVGPLYTDQHHQQSQHADHHNGRHDVSGTVPSPPSRHPSDPDTSGALGLVGPSSEDQKRQRRTTIMDAPSHVLSQQQMAAPPRRSSTPVISETLVSRIDREKSTKCFQTPVSVKDTYSRDTKLNPALSNLVQQHRKDYQINTRLGGSVPAPTQTSQGQIGPLTVDTSLLRLRDRDARAGTHRRDSSGSQSQSSSSPHQHPVYTGTPPTPLTPLSGPAVEGHVRRLSGSQQQLPLHPYPSGHRGTFTGSHGNLLNAAALASVKQQQQQQQQQQLQQQQQHLQQPSPPFTPHGAYSNSQGRHRTAPQRQSSASYFNLPLQQQQQQFAASVTNISPFPSPVLGATSTPNTTLGHPHELSVAMQHQQYQQQQVQLHIQQQQLQQLQQQHIVQQQLPQQGYYQSVSPLALLQHQQQYQHNQHQQHHHHQQQQQQHHQQQQQQQQNQQQQLEHLQHIRIQQQQILLQQQQQLQQQLEQTRAVVTAAAAAAASASAAAATTSTAALEDSATKLNPSTVSITTPTPLSQPELVQQQQEQQQQQSMMNRATMHFGLPAAPVLTTAMGLGMGLGVDPVGMNHMNLLGMGGVPMGVNMNMLNMGAGPSSNLVPQLLMAPQLTPQMLAYPNVYSYQPAAGLTTAGGSMALAAAAGGSVHTGVA